MEAMPSHSYTSASAVSSLFAQGYDVGNGTLRLFRMATKRMISQSVDGVFDTLGCRLFTPGTIVVSRSFCRKHCINYFASRELVD